MTIEQRKIELIKWITDMENGSLIQHIEEIRDDSQEETPAEILSLLNSSNACASSELIEHISTKDMLAS
jgi:hypothetical protein